jgi:metal-dependent amidase/aminoacylase/carboxypeptidase family protein
MMVHPGPHDSILGGYLAASTQKIEYHGRSSHASACPQLGVNAADALTVAQTAIGLLRQHIRPSDRIHGIVTHGGDAPNVIPAYTSASYILRATSLEELKGLSSRVHACFRAGATATGCGLRITGGDKPYAEMHQDQELIRIYRHHAESLGRRFPNRDSAVSVGASTDMGNVSRVVPSMHPSIGIESFPAVNHQPEFAAHCVTPAADKAVGDGAQTMALTVVDVATDRALRNHFLALRESRKNA